MLDSFRGKDTLSIANGTIPQKALLTGKLIGTTKALLLV